MFVDLAEFFDAQSRQTAEANGDVHTSKKRKLEASQGNDAHRMVAIHQDWKSNTFNSIKDVSFLIPLRKKLTLEIGNLKDQGVRARNPSSGDVEFGVSYKDIRESP